MNRNTVMVTDGVAKKPPRVFLYECAFVISCDEFIVMPVSIKDACRIYITCRCYLYQNILIISDEQRELRQ